MADPQISKNISKTHENTRKRSKNTMQTNKMSQPLTIPDWVPGFSVLLDNNLDKDELLKKDFLDVFNQNLVVNTMPEMADLSFYSTDIETDSGKRDQMNQFIRGWHYWHLTPGLQSDYVNTFKESLSHA